MNRRFPLIYLAAIVMISCNTEADIYITLTEQSTGSPIDSATIYVSRPDGTNQNYGSFTGITDSNGMVRFSFLKSEIKSYNHTIMSYKDGFYLTEFSAYEIENVKSEYNVNLKLSESPTEFHKQMQSGGLIEVE